MRRIAVAVVAALVALSACGGSDDETATTTTIASATDGWMESSPDHDECLRLSRMYDALVNKATDQLGLDEFERTKDDIQSIVDDQVRLRC